MHNMLNWYVSEAVLMVAESGVADSDLSDPKTKIGESNKLALSCWPRMSSLA